MSAVGKLIQPLLNTLLLILFVGLLSEQTQFGGNLMLWGFILVMAVRWLAESLLPHAEVFKNRHHQSEHSRWLLWAVGLSFLTNLVLPIADYRYRGEWSWTSPFARDPWWSWIGLLILAAGVAVRIQALWQYAPPKTEPAKRKQKKASEPARVGLEPAESKLFHLFDLGAAIAYLGIALLFSSLWALLFWAVLILPTAVYRIHKVRVTTSPPADKVMA
ncbi:MAG: hypothetical protein ONB48_14720 [candidate division KSB1 bacterium]|nr:hypothetical protein [candidate division KSB1 bacterium]MDZ7273510.1 hypothetical protein [candidate division KSB1 bacterium]MDZ7286899.1 hypothetical protein [candidate division KSB1 bacterium]MDZ7299748.1 hypothetical protein [candidate division KSB1 bacterium]MDZ7305687.1 hypothetical protein [candidate division KSB1 bacterium]